MNNPFSLIGRRIVITGASSGIGRECAIRCSRSGASLILVARDPVRLEETRTLLEAGDHRILSLDLSDTVSIEPAMASCLGSGGPVTGLVHAAGIEKTKPLSLMKAADYTDLFLVNVLSGFELARILSKKGFYDSTRGSSMVFISSVMGNAGQKGKTAYCSTKGALQAGSRALALELAAKNIRVNTVLPGLVETEMTRKLFEGLPVESRQTILDLHPLGIGRPEDVAHAVQFLLSEAARWITGTELVVDGGYLAQ